MSERSGEAVVVDLEDFVRETWPLPPSRHPVNAPAGGFLLSLVREAAYTYHRSEGFPDLDEWMLIKFMKNQVPGEPESDIEHAKRFTRRAYEEIKKGMEAGEISGLPPRDKSIPVIGHIKLKVQPTLLDREKKVVYDIRSHTLRTPLRSEMWMQYMLLVGLSLAYPAPPWRICLVGFDRRTGNLQKLWYGKQEQRTPEFLEARDTFLKKLQDYTQEGD